MSKKRTWVAGTFATLILAGFASPVFAQTVAVPENWAPMIAKIIMGLSLSLGLSGSAMGLGVSFQALLGSGEENFFKNIAVAMMPSTQGIYSIVVFFSNIDGFATDPYTVAGRAATFGSGHVLQRLVSGNRMCSGHQEHPGGEKHRRQRSGLRRHARDLRGLRTGHDLHHEVVRLFPPFLR